MKKLFLLCIAAPAFAGTPSIFTPVLGVGDCVITGVSGATPAVVTVADITKCGLTTNGTQIWIWGAQNTGSLARYSAINGHLESSADTNGLCRVANGISGNTFQVYGCDGTTAVANNGTWSFGGRVAKGQFRTRKDLPVADFDGAGGYLDTCIQSSAPGGCYESGRLERTALDNVYTLMPAYMTSGSVKHADRTGSWTEKAALRWAAAGKPGSGTERDIMRRGLLNNLMMPTTACNTTVSAGCGYGASYYLDYPFEIWAQIWIRNYNIGLSQLTSGEIQTISDNMLGDYDWTRGGHNYSGTNLTFPALTTGNGTISWTSGGTTITGDASATFTTQLSVGDFILIGNSVYPRWYEVTAIGSNSLLTIGMPIQDEDGTLNGQAYKIGRAWVQGTDIGALGWHMRDYYSSLCMYGYSGEVGVGGPVGCADYAEAAGIYSNETWHNHSIGRLVNWMMRAITFAEHDPRWKWLATDAMFLFQHLFQPGMIRNMGGISHATPSYHYVRLAAYAAAALGGLKNSFSDSPQFLDGDNSAFFDGLAALALTDGHPGRNPVSLFETAGEADSPPFQALFLPGVLANLYNSSGSLAPAVRQHLEVDAGTLVYGSSILAASGDGGASVGPYIGVAYLGNRPSVTAARSSNTSFFTANNYSANCLNIWTTSVCSPDRRFFLGSRAGTSAGAAAWNGTALNMRYDFSSTGVRDHAAQQHSVGPHISANGKIMLGGDGLYGGYYELPQGSIFVLGSESNFKAGDQNSPYGTNGLGASTPIFYRATSTVAAAGVSTTNHYKTASGVTAASRAVVHAKGTGYGFIVMRDDFTASSSLTATSYWHYFIADSCGTPSSPSCTTIDRAAGTVAHTQTGARLNTKFITGTVNTENSSNTNCSYTGQAGRSCRVTQALTGTSGSLFTVHQPTSTTSDTMPTIATQDIGVSKVIEIQHSSAPVVAVLAPNGTVNLTSISSFTTGHAGTAQYVFTGLAAGSYSVKRGGTEVCAVTVISGDHVAECNMLAGAITVVAASGGTPSAYGLRGGVLRGGTIR